MSAPLVAVDDLRELIRLISAEPRTAAETKLLGLVLAKLWDIEQKLDTVLSWVERP